MSYLSGRCLKLFFAKQTICAMPWSLDWLTDEQHKIFCQHSHNDGLFEYLQFPSSLGLDAYVLLYASFEGSLWSCFRALWLGKYVYAITLMANVGPKCTLATTVCVYTYSAAISWEKCKKSTLFCDAVAGSLLVRSVLWLMTFISEVATLIWLEGDPLFN